MAKRNITSFDLNLLVVFDALMRERSVTRAGAAVGLSQPSMSNALSRLREQCSDPLFVRSREGMQPTALALRLAGPVQRALAMLRESLEGEVAFDPASSDRTFRLLLSDVGEIVILPRLIRHLEKVAPMMSVRSVQLPRDRHRDALEAGDVDLAIVRDVRPDAGLLREHLYDDRYVCLVRKGHPQIGSRMSLKKFLAASHIAVEMPGAGPGMFEQMLNAHRLHCRIALTVPHYLVAPLIVAKTDLLVAVPEEIIPELPRPLAVRSLPLPFDPGGIQVHQYWHRRFDADPASRWLRQQIQHLFRSARRD